MILIMAIAEMFLWWYTRGWRVFVSRAKNWFSGVSDFFSMDSLVRTLFKPYRQISADATGTTPMQGFLDRLVSRCIGFVARLALLLVGCLTMILSGVVCLVTMILWPLLPFLPVAGIILSIVGVTL